MDGASYFQSMKSKRHYPQRVRLTARGRDRADAALERTGLTTWEERTRVTGISKGSYQRFKGHTGVSQNTARGILRALKFEEEEFGSLIEPVEAVEEIDQLISTQSAEAVEQKLISTMRQICQAQLDETLPSTANPFTRRVGISFTWRDTYVPIGVAVQEKPLSYVANVAAQRGSEFYGSADFSSNKKLSPKDFLGETIQSSKSTKARIAIIGEPGAGKSTFLQNFAHQVFEEYPSHLIIWIPIAKLEQQSLEEYLVEVWLKAALRHSEVSPSMKEGLVRLFFQHQVWLLLDGVDEMQTAASPLAQLSRYLSVGWIKQANVVLTCRIAHWQADWNNQSNYKVYRLLDLNESLSPTNLLDDLIAKLWSHNPEGGHRFRDYMNAPQNLRLRDLAKNPLRLIMLCQIWELHEGNLPETKAEIFKEFIRATYQWREVSIEKAELDNLHHALGQLALQAMESEKSRFRIRRSLVEKVFESCPALLRVATEGVGWLNPIGYSVEKPKEEVFAFWHPTLQEYFASNAIASIVSDQDRWNFFLPCNHLNKPVGSKETSKNIYRIFEAHWKEVFLLWIGNQDNSNVAEKERLIEKLLEFEDGCGGFYRIRAWCLAAAGIAEFYPSNFRTTEKIINQVVEWAIGVHFFAEGEPYKSDDPFCLPVVSRALNPNFGISFVIANQARDALKETNISEAVSRLIELLNNNPTKSSRLQIIWLLGQIGKGNREVANVLTLLLQDEETRSTSLHSLLKVGTGSLDTIKALTKELKEWERNNKFSWEADSTFLLNEVCQLISRILNNLNLDDREYILTLKQELPLFDEDADPIQDFNRRFVVLKSLARFGFVDVDIVRNLLDLHEHGLCSETDLVHELSLNKDKSTQSLSSLMRERDIRRRLKVAILIVKLDPNNTKALKNLNKILLNPKVKSNHFEVYLSLGYAGINMPEVIRFFIQQFNTSLDERKKVEIVEILTTLGCIQEALPRAIRLATFQSSEETQLSIIQVLAKGIGFGYPGVKDNLKRLMNSSTSQKVQIRIACHLSKDDENKLEAINKIASLFENQNEDEKLEVVEFLIENGVKSLTFSMLLEQIIGSARTYELTSAIARYFGLLGIDCEKAYSILIKSIRNTSDYNTLINSLKDLLEIQPGNSFVVSTLMSWLEMDLQFNVTPPEPNTGIPFYQKNSAAHLITRYGSNGKLGNAYLKQSVTLLRQMFDRHRHLNYPSFYGLAFHCAERMNYAEFYRCLNQ